MKLRKFHLKFLMQFRRVCDKLSNLTKLRLGAFFCRQSWSLADVSWPSFNQLVSLSIRQLVIRSVFVIQWVGSVRQCDNYLRNELNNLYFPLEWLLQVFFPRSLRFCFLHFNCSLAAKSGDGGGKWGGEVPGGTACSMLWKIHIQHCLSQLGALSSQRSEPLFLTRWLMFQSDSVFCPTTIPKRNFQLTLLWPIVSGCVVAVGGSPISDLSQPITG